MKFLFDLFPLILFFGVFKWGEGHEQAAHGIVQQYLGGLMTGGSVTAAVSPVILATVVGIIATALQIGYLMVQRKKVDGMLWVSAAVITIMGGATIYLHDETFIKWKPTILYWTFAAILLVYQLFKGKNLMKSVLGEAFKLPEEVWPRVCFAWIWFLFALGLLNLLMAFVIFKGNTSAWVNFKVFGATGLFFAFTVAQAFVLSKYLQEEA
ncbi:septation protein A [Massilia sp. R2A-15]|uniref:septation protein A n=1 Tax=Massilia sp. R2A-15 TaxID=3064278 RepID=UPI0027325629|nr:septation protein A [Massilia sp. R2A-15]WLI91280.1 septation protein A [Massilia sp. R2A-15]